MIEFIITVVFLGFIIWLSFSIGYWFRGHIITSTIRKVLEEIDEKNKNLVTRLHSTDTAVVEDALTEAAKTLNITLLKSEQVGGQYFFYTKDTDQFVCQGTTLEEACANYYKVNRNSIGCVADPTNETDSYFIVEGKIQHKLVDA